ncbi:molybdopterin-guanine dinucleotide biosynthesis protein B [Paenibacillus arenilitoris]|uniref:Molybdopterin-guanine dinucleotide biosynthesis protein B n=1 Tax=Paenibacillus arenilitoris TaxID=2772299 RepID=A0A927CL35_9BACL|nr:molybdopterin-guanine dinucleotide biosynthesis protein B [Paenibacillus arenilitoris]MBD2867851.1 molybdopterin-guanine dinucleotide biosynthesis protein B [Paenibacillus arenilitoris]
MPQPASQAPIVVQIVGYKNTGKTTLVCRLIEYFKQAGYKVGTIKRDAHEFQIDTPGTDTWKHQEAGADMTAITSATRTAVMKRSPEPLARLIDQLREADVILVEGFKTDDYPKIVMIRSVSDLELLQAVSRPVAAAVWPGALPPDAPSLGVPAIGIDRVDELYSLAVSLAR